MNNMKSFLPRLKSDPKGQSFMELTVVLGVLLMLLLGMVEFSLLLNQYVALVDAAREGARRGAGGQVDPYTSTYTANETFFTDIDDIIEGQSESTGALDAIILNPTTDDVVITFYRIVGNSIEATYGWSKHSLHTSQVNIESTVNSSSAPDSGVVVVEIFYSHPSIFLPDPIPVHAYAIMPLPKAKPTAVP